MVGHNSATDAYGNDHSLWSTDSIIESIPLLTTTSQVVNRLIWNGTEASVEIYTTTSLVVESTKSIFDFTFFPTTASGVHYFLTHELQLVARTY